MWEYLTNPGRWVFTIGDWRAVVERVPRTQEWCPRIERIGEPAEHHSGPTVRDPIDGRAWCLRAIAERRNVRTPS